jgi:hypothetical protein
VIPLIVQRIHESGEHHTVYVKNEHGRIFSEEIFGGFSVSPDLSSVTYVAEEFVATPLFEHLGDWGESYTNRGRPQLVTLNFETGAITLHKLDLDVSDVCAPHKHAQSCANCVSLFSLITRR